MKMRISLRTNNIFRKVTQLKCIKLTGRVDENGREKTELLRVQAHLLDGGKKRCEIVVHIDEDGELASDALEQRRHAVEIVGERVQLGDVQKAQHVDRVAQNEALIARCESIEDLHAIQKMFLER